MSHTIRGFQQDQALMLVDTFNKRIPDNVVSVERVEALMVKHGIVNDYTLWKKIEDVIGDLGYDYDEIMEVAP